MENTFEMSTGADYYELLLLSPEICIQCQKILIFLTCVRYLKRIKKNMGEQVSSLFNIWVFIPLWSMLLSVSSLL